MCLWWQQCQQAKKIQVMFHTPCLCSYQHITGTNGPLRWWSQTDKTHVQLSSLQNSKAANYSKSPLNNAEQYLIPSIFAVVNWKDPTTINMNNSNITYILKPVKTGASLFIFMDMEQIVPLGTVWESFQMWSHLRNDRKKHLEALGLYLEFSIRPWKQRNHWCKSDFFSFSLFIVTPNCVCDIDEVCCIYIDRHILEAMWRCCAAPGKKSCFFTSTCPDYPSASCKIFCLINTQTYRRVPSPHAVPPSMTKRHWAKAPE